MTLTDASVGKVTVQIGRPICTVTFPTLASVKVILPLREAVSSLLTVPETLT